VKIDKRLASMARALSSSLGITSAELLSELIRQPLTEAFEKRFRDLSKAPDNNQGEGEADR
jgi:predicted methyltransferase